ncbi:MAG: LysR family transcriptional regulator [Francisellaceae bacterium]
MTVITEKISILLLRIFHTVARTKSITEAAENLNMSQASISNSLSRLRSIFNDHLLIRKENKMELTPKGEALIKEVSEILSRLEKVQRFSIPFDPKREKRHYKIAMTGHSQFILLPMLIKELASYPVTLEISSAPYYYSEFATPYPDVDLITGLLKPPEQLRYQNLFTTKAVVIGHANNKILQKPSFTVDDYFAAKHIIVHSIAPEHNPVLEYISTPDRRNAVVKVEQLADLVVLQKCC